LTSIDELRYFSLQDQKRAPEEGASVDLGRKVVAGHLTGVCISDECQGDFPGADSGRVFPDPG
jgi:hypothetical protein